MESFRYFPFFEKKIVGDDFFISKADCEKLSLGSFVSCSGSENSIWFGSSDGRIHEIGLKDGLLSVLEIWKAYNTTVFDIKYTQNTLITIGIDDDSKWKIKLYDCLDGNVLSSKLGTCNEICISSELEERNINIFEVCKYNQFMALGTVDEFGILLLYGNFFRPSSYSSNFIRLGEPCTSINFISSKNEDEYYMMVCTKTCVYSYLLTINSLSPKLIYCDSMGGSNINCSSVLYNWDNDVSGVNDILVIFREEGLFCYHPLNGNCSALPTNSGNPTMLSTFKNYLILVSSQSYEDSNFSSKNPNDGSGSRRNNNSMYKLEGIEDNSHNRSGNDNINGFLRQRDGIVGKIESINLNNNSNSGNICDITICSYFPELRFICYTGEYNNVMHIVKGLNMLFILCSGTTCLFDYNFVEDNKLKKINVDCGNNVQNILFHLDELNIFERIQILIDKNLYEWALVLAKNEDVNKSIYNQVQRSYGDWLCNIRKDYKSALNCYLNCLNDTNRYDTSHVVYNFLKANKLNEALVYLKECVSQSRGKESSKIHFNSNKENKLSVGKESVELLYRLLAHLERFEDIYEFLELRNSNQEIDNYETEIAIDICRSYNRYEMASKISKLFQYHEKYMSIQIEDKKSYKEALNYLQDIKLDETQKLSLILKYGSVLICNLQKSTTKFIKSLVINNNMPIDVFLPIFIDQDKLLLDLTWDVLTNDGNKSEIRSDDIEELSVELCINILQISLRQEPPIETWPKVILERLISVENSENWYSILCICIHYKYNYGVYYICKNCDLDQFAVSQYILKDDIQGLIEFCKYSGNKNPFVWQEALSFILNKLSLNKERDNILLVNYIKIILENINSLKLVSPLTILDLFSKYLSDKESDFELLNISVIKPLLLPGKETAESTDFSTENMKGVKNSVLSDNYEIKKMKGEIKNLKNRPKILSSSRCSQCHLPLELPVVHFLCDHSFHKYCLSIQNQCPICSNERQNKIKFLKQREIQQTNKELFFKFIKGDLNRNSGFDYISKSMSVLFK
ncbi:hypothetical protein FG386_000612 [Cryptosporidium ryanae]|uniref:uncharacterized protein n=1 Tax=Cryptosporidium ryanae TaxID=515981 RepID=UPI00351A1DCF|nr:hypothetical protein FG386_000612 [Cryptosporidium ryanae]